MGVFLLRAYPAGENNFYSYAAAGLSSPPYPALSPPSLTRANLTYEGRETPFFTPSTDTYGTKQPFFASHFLALV